MRPADAAREIAAAAIVLVGAVALPEGLRRVVTAAIAAAARHGGGAVLAAQTEATRVAGGLEHGGGIS